MAATVSRCYAGKLESMLKERGLAPGDLLVEILNIAAENGTATQAFTAKNINDVKAVFVMPKTAMAEYAKTWSASAGTVSVVWSASLSTGDVFDALVIGKYASTTAAGI